MLVLQHANPAAVVDGRLTIDRKFLTGMDTYVRSIAAPMVSVHPASKPGQPIMDPVTVPLADLPFRVLALDVDRRGRLAGPGRDALRELLLRARLLYGAGVEGSALCRELGVPVIAVLEYDLPTQLAVTLAEVDNPMRKLSRAVRTSWSQLRAVPALARAAGVHCNGYPVYLDARRVNRAALLYLDSRVKRDEVIDADRLARRLERRGAGPLRLLFSGRYERIKGALDAVKAAAAALDRGLAIEMVCYGQGSLGPAMREIAARYPSGAITIHDAIPYPELAALAQGFDLFICCHVQSDPSCTYLESFGAGLPIVGYDNRMWRHLCADAGAGIVVPIGSTDRVAKAIGRYAADAALLRRHSLLARQFALDHCFEAEFAKRTDDINRHLAKAPTRY